MNADVWARVVTPTSEVRVQCISHAASSPAAITGDLSTDPPVGPAAQRRGAESVSMSSRVLSIVVAAALVYGTTGMPPTPGAVPFAASTSSPAASSTSSPAASSPWSWPVAPRRVVRHYHEPAHAFGPGHRGIDLAAAPGDPVRAPAAGVVAFSGRVVDRGVVTIDHGDGHVTTFEPISDAVPAGTEVVAGADVARVATGGHAAAGTLHFGVRLDGRYINPLSLLGGIPRAVLLPCC